VLQCIAVSCSIVQCVAVSCSVYADGRMRAVLGRYLVCSVLQCVSSVLQCVVVRCGVCADVCRVRVVISMYLVVCSVLQHVIVWCSVLRCVAERCSLRADVCRMRTVVGR